MRNWHYRRNFGISIAEYERLLAAQHGRCKICEAKHGGRWKTFAVDHDHATGRVRGLLCSHCNYIIVGLLEKKPGMLDKLNKYLEYRL